MEQTHPLAVWLRDQKLSREQFAATLGIGRPYLSAIITGKRHPSRQLCAKIRIATQGAITAEAFEERADG